MKGALSLGHGNTSLNSARFLTPPAHRHHEPPGDQPIVDITNSRPLHRFECTIHYDLRLLGDHVSRATRYVDANVAWTRTSCDPSAGRQTPLLTSVAAMPRGEDVATIVALTTIRNLPPTWMTAD